MRRPGPGWSNPFRQQHANHTHLLQLGGELGEEHEQGQTTHVGRLPLALGRNDPLAGWHIPLPVLVRDAHQHGKYYSDHHCSSVGHLCLSFVFVLCVSPLCLQTLATVLGELGPGNKVKMRDGSVRVLPTNTTVIRDAFCVLYCGWPGLLAQQPCPLQPIVEFTLH